MRVLLNNYGSLFSSQSFPFWAGLSSRVSLFNMTTGQRGFVFLSISSFARRSSQPSSGLPPFIPASHRRLSNRPHGGNASPQHLRGRNFTYTANQVIQDIGHAPTSCLPISLHYIELCKFQRNDSHAQIVDK